MPEYEQDISPFPFVDVITGSLFILKDIADIVDDSNIYTGEPVVATILEVA